MCVCGCTHTYIYYILPNSFQVKSSDFLAESLASHAMPRLGQVAGAQPRRMSRKPKVSLGKSTLSDVDSPSNQSIDL